MHIYEFSYKVDTVLYQFLETGTSDRCLIGIVQLLRFSGFILYPLSFFLYCPSKINGCIDFSQFNSLALANLMHLYIYFLYKIIYYQLQFYTCYKNYI